LLLTTSGRGTLVEGSAVITVERGAVSATSLVEFAGAGTVEIAGGSASSGFVAPVWRDTTPGTALVLALSAGPTATTVDLTLRDADGRPMRNGSARVTLPAHGHTVRALERLFSRAFTPGFRGSLVARSTGSGVASALLELGSEGTARIPLLAMP
jgi:hypothetical protein